MARNKFRVGAVSVLVALTLVAPVAAGAVWVLRAATESPLESDATAEPLVGVVESAQRAGSVSVSIAVEFAEVRDPVTSHAGTVTHMPVAVGDELTTGTHVMSVNDQRVIAYTAEAPLWRDIARTTSGDDVAIAQQLLNDLGFDAGEADGIAGWQTEQAIRAFNVEHGYGERNPVLSLNALVWVGVAPIEVGELLVQLGDTVAPGTALLTPTTGMSFIAVTEPPSLDASQEYTLSVGEATVPFEVGSGRVADPEHVAQIAAQLGGFTEGAGMVQLVNPVTVGTVPASAVVTDERGTVCVFPSVDGEPVTVEPLGGTLGTVDLAVDLIGQAVLLNPREVREDVACG